MKVIPDHLKSGSGFRFSGPGHVTLWLQLADILFKAFYNLVSVFNRRLWSITAVSHDNFVVLVYSLLSCLEDLYMIPFTIFIIYTFHLEMYLNSLADFHYIIYKKKFCLLSVRNQEHPSLIEAPLVILDSNTRKLYILVIHISARLSSPPGS